MYSVLSCCFNNFIFFFSKAWESGYISIILNSHQELAAVCICKRH